MSESPSCRPVRHPGLDTVVSIQTGSPIAPLVEVTPESSAGGAAAGVTTPSTPQIIIRPDFADESSQNGTDQDTAQQQDRHHHHHHHHHTGPGGSITILTPPAPTSASSAISRINICINTHYPLAPNPMPQPRRLHEQYGLSDDVLVRKEHDDRYYLGTIIAIGEHKCLVRFDDGTKCWSFFDDMKKMQNSGSDGAAGELVDRVARMPRPMCVVCKEDNPQQVVEVCEKCRRSYHPRCQTDAQPDHNVDEDPSPEPGPWLCRCCTMPSVTPPPSCSGLAHRFVGTGLSRELDPLTDKNQLPYDMDALVWDADHQVNQSGQYCYCGEDGDWTKEMIQCCWCHQWFHGRCIRSLQFPIFLGDRFYVLLCSICNGGHEFVRRLETSYSDLLQLVLYNLIMRNGQRLFSLQRAILPYLEDNLRALQAPDHITHASPSVRAEAVENTFRKERNIFINGKEANKSPSLWSLRVCKAPGRMAFVIPRGETVTEGLLQQLESDDRLPRILPRAYLEKSLVTDAATRERMTCIKYNVTPFSEVDPRQTSKSTATDPQASSTLQLGGALPKKRGRPSRAASARASGLTEPEPFLMVRHASSRRKQRTSASESWRQALRAAQDLPSLLSQPCLIDRIIPLPRDLLGEDNPFRNDTNQVAAPRSRQARMAKRRRSTNDALGTGRGKKMKLNVGGGTAVRVTPEPSARQRAAEAAQPSGQNSAPTAGSDALPTVDAARGGRRLRPRSVANYSDTRQYRPRRIASQSRRHSTRSSISTANESSDDESFLNELDEVFVKLERFPDDSDHEQSMGLMEIEKVEDQIAEPVQHMQTEETRVNSASLPTCHPVIKGIRTFPDGSKEYLWE